MTLSIRALLPVALLWFGLLPGAQSVRLSGPLDLRRVGSVRSSDVTSDGAFAVFLADRDTPDIYELYSVPTDGSGLAVRLNDPLLAGQIILQWAIGADDRVVYRVTADTLFSVPADGSTPPLALSPPGITHSFLTTRNDVRALVRVSPDTSTPASVHVVPIDGGPAFELPGTAGLAPFGFSPDGTLVVLGQQDPTRAATLHICPADGTAPPVELARHDLVPHLPNALLFFEGFSADLLHLVYQVEFGSIFGHPIKDSEWSLYSVPIDGSAPPLQLTNFPSLNRPPLVALQAGGFGGRIAFVDDEELVSTRFDGSARRILTPPGVTVPHPARFAADGTELFFLGVLASGNSTILRVLFDGSAAPIALFPPRPGFCRDMALAGSAELLCLVDHGPNSLVSVPRAGGSPKVLASGPDGHGPVMYEQMANGVLFSTDASGHEELAFVPLDGSAAPLVLSERLPGDPRLSFQAHPDGTSALYTTQVVPGINQLYCVPLDASSPPLELTTPVFTDETIGWVLEFAVTPDLTRTVYRLQSYEAKLLVVELALPGVALELSGADDVGPGFVPTSDSTRVLYRTRAGALRIVPLDGSAAPLTLDAAGANGILAPVLTRDGAHAVYDGGHGLRRVALDGSGAPLQLIEPPVGITQAFPRAIVLDHQNENAFFQLEFQLESQPFRTHLWQVPLDGSAPARLLHPEISGAGGVLDFRVTPDGRHVVYHASHVEGPERELYAVALEGNRTPRRLNPAAHRMADFGSFELSADGRQVVVRAEQFPSGNYGLFGAPVDGKLRTSDGPPSGAGRAFVPLTHLSSARNVRRDFQLAGDTVVFRANAEVTDRIEVFRNPLDSGRGRLRLSGPMTPGGDASALTLSDGGQWVVYVADQNTDTVRELFAVPTAGGSAQSLFVLPNFSLIDGWSAEESAGLVHFRADALANEQYELFSVPLDASAPAQLRNSPLGLQGDVEPDFLPLGDGRLIFRADATLDGQPELYLTL